MAIKLMGESKLEAVFPRLDRLTTNETWTTVAETLGLVHTLLGDIKVVIEGAEYLHDRPLIFILGAHPVR